MTDVADRSPFDIDTLRARYRAERDRRATPDAGRMYLDITGFKELHADPYSNSSPRAPVDDRVDVLIVGGGFGGLLTAARLREAGVERIRIVEVGGDFGGTWYWNRYPGAACDIESYIYMPLLEETGYMPTERYAKADGDPRPRAAHRRAFRPLRPRAVLDAGDVARLGRRGGELADRH